MNDLNNYLITKRNRRVYVRSRKSNRHLWRYRINLLKPWKNMPSELYTSRSGFSDLIVSLIYQNEGRPIDIQITEMKEET